MTNIKSRHKIRDKSQKNESYDIIVLIIIITYNK